MTYNTRLSTDEDFAQARIDHANDPEVYTCTLCGWYTSNDEDDIYEHRGSWHVDF